MNRILLALVIAAVALGLWSSRPSATSQTLPNPRSELILTTLTAMNHGAMAGPGLILGAPGASGILYSENPGASSGGPECVTVSNLGDCTISVQNGNGTQMLAVKPHTSGSFTVDTAGGVGMDLSWLFGTDGPNGIAVWVIRGLP